VRGADTGPSPLTRRPSDDGRHPLPSGEAFAPNIMDWFQLFSRIEATSLSVWVRESQSLLAFPAILTLHAIGMGFLAGTAAAMDLRIMGFARRIAIPSLEALVPIMRFGFWVNAISGLLLVIAFPTRQLTNPVFYVKLSLIAIALVDTKLLLQYVIRKPSMEGENTQVRAKLMAAASLILWAGAIVAGRLLYYTFTRRDPFGNPY